MRGFLFELQSLPSMLLRSKIGLLLALAIALVVISYATIVNQPANYAKAVAGDGVSSNIRLLDTNANGKLDRITFDIANVNGETWSLTGEGPYGISVTQGGADISVSSVSITSAANATPVTVQVDLNEGDTDLLFDTNGVTTGAMELIYTQGNTGTNCTVQNCITDDTDEELNAIATGDTGGTDTESDWAVPVFDSTSFVFNETAVDGRVDRVQWTMSEAVSTEGDGSSGFTFANTNLLTFATPTQISSEGTATVSLLVLGPVNVTGDTLVPTIAFSTEGSTSMAATQGSVSTVASAGPFNISDNTVPQIVGLSPVAGSTVSSLADFTVVFSEPIDTGSLTFTDSDVTAGDYESLIWANNDTRATFRHNTGWADGVVTITITVAPDTNANGLGSVFATNPFTFTADSTVSEGGGGSSYQQLLQQEQQQQQEEEDAANNDTTTDDETSTDDGTTSDDTTTEDESSMDDTSTEEESAPMDFGNDEAGNPLIANSLVTTADSSAVYHVDANGVRHAFTHISVYQSWFGNDFSAVVDVSSSTLASLPLGDPVTYRPGTMIKIPSIARVYLVIGNRQIRHIDNEAVAEALFGDQWNTMIFDVSDSFFFLYEDLADPITDASEIDFEAMAMMHSNLDIEIRS